MLTFEWDSLKAKTNLAKHGVTFEEACTVFADDRSLTIDDPSHSKVERRNITLGLASTGRMLVVIHTERGGRIRIISSRQGSRKEKRQYEKE